MVYHQECPRMAYQHQPDDHHFTPTPSRAPSRNPNFHPTFTKEHLHQKMA